LEESESLQKEYKEIKAYYSAMDKLEPVKAPADFLGKVNERLDSRSVVSRIINKLFFPLKIKIPLEFAGLVCTVLVIILILKPFDRIKESQIVYEYSEVEDYDGPGEKIFEKKAVAPQALPAPSMAEKPESAVQPGKSRTLKKAKPNKGLKQQDIKTAFGKSSMLKRSAKNSMADLGAGSPAPAEQKQAMAEPMAPKKAETKEEIKEEIEVFRAGNGAASTKNHALAADYSNIAVVEEQNKEQDIGVLSLLISDKSFFSDSLREEPPGRFNNQNVIISIEKLIKDHKGTYSRSHCQDHVEYTIEIPANKIEFFLKEMSGLGKITDNKLKKQSSSKKIVGFKLLIN
ncbi:MAG: hypothetical protein ABIA63_09350, partial [bacterium]